jgi:hypothetical protein
VYKEVILSDGDPCQVRGLGLFELEQVGPEIPGPYTYDILTVTGVIYRVEYDLKKNLERPPQKPVDEPPDNLNPASPEWAAWNEWDHFQAAIAHERARFDVIEEYLTNVAAYITEHCLETADQARLVEPEDYRAVYAAALVPRLTLDDIEKALKSYRATYKGDSVLQAIFAMKGTNSGSRADVIQLWEAELMNSLGIADPEAEAAYAQLPVFQRARKLVAHKLPDWFDALGMEAAARKGKK